MRSSPSCTCSSPHVSLCVVTPPSFRYQQRWGLAAGLLYSWAVALRATSTPQTPLGWTKKIKFFVVSLCVLCHKPYITLLHIQTLMCGVVERSSGNDTTAGGEEVSPTTWSSSSSSLSSPFLLLFLTCTKRLIFGLKKKASRVI